MKDEEIEDWLNSLGNDEMVDGETDEMVDGETYEMVDGETDDMVDKNKKKKKKSSSNKSIHDDPLSDILF